MRGNFGHIRRKPGWHIEQTTCVYNIAKDQKRVEIRGSPFGIEGRDISKCPSLRAHRKFHNVKRDVFKLYDFLRPYHKDMNSTLPI